MSLPNGLISFGPGANCTLEICPVEWSILQYRPSVPSSAVFIAIFGLSLLLNVGQGIYYHTWGYMSSLVAGCILEIAGYVGRLILYNNPFDFSGFLLQIVCITVAPVFFCAAIYVLLSQTITHINPHISRFKPKLLYWIFIPCDIVSLVLQAVGGALSCIASTEDGVQLGVDISLAGLVFQVFTLTTFTVTFLDYLNSCRRHRMQLDRRMKVFLYLLFLSIFLILLRCVYRVVELHEGYFSHFFRDEVLFIALESAIMGAAAITMNLGHPGLVFGKKYKKGDISEMDLQFALLNVDADTGRPRT
ncbi:Putative Parasitic phase-specific protein psp-1 (Fragment) [Aspergillus calidoustus]|uniref:Putative Parasitic phase-specific protein psp-1 n=1 Tax=Aspergillus calidoustus TaxID=454130 RepID=A0A0U5GEF2_ASPCI